MDKKSFLRRILAVFLTVVLSAGVVFIGAPENAYAASKYKLVSKVTRYYKDGNTWKKYAVTTYTYNKKGDPVKIYIKYLNGRDYKRADYYEYTYKNGKKVRADHFVKEGTGDKYMSDYMTYDKKGRLKEVVYPDIRREVYTYGKNGYLTRIKSDDWARTMKYTWNGKVAKTMKVKLTDYPGFVYYATFNKKGLIQEPVSRTEANGVMKYTYDFKGGRVSKINKTTADGFERYYDRYVVSYTNKSINAKRYLAMINEIVVGYPANTGMTWF